jgi:N-methylhydantoinase B
MQPSPSTEEQSPSVPRVGTRLDPLTFSLVLYRLAAITAEMTTTLEHAAMTPVLALCRDYSCCIHDAGGRQVASVDALPIHTNSMHLVVREMIDFFGEDIHEGDVIACNDAYSMNTHIGDLVTAAPVFVDGELLFWSATRGHQLDVGAPVPTAANPWAEDVWQEGLRIPPMKLYEEGKPRRDVLNMYLSNVRWPNLLEGDLRAQLGSVWTGAKRLRELCDRYGRDTVVECCSEAISYAQRRARAELRNIRNGEYDAVGWVDEGPDGARDLPVRCRVRIEDEHVEVDFAGSAPQIRAGANASFAVMQAAGAIPLMLILDPDIPINHGSLGCVRVSAPSGSICNAAYPAATSKATTDPADLMQDVVTKALVDAVPERTAAGSGHWSNLPMLSGVDPTTGRSWGHLLLNPGAGGGAADGADGWPLMLSNASRGGLKVASIEHTEQLYPIRIAEWEIESESMGLGRHIGGPGVRCTIEPLEAAVDMVSKSDGLRNPPYGVLGGTPGAGGGAFVQHEDGSTQVLTSTVRLMLRPGDRWTAVSTGGGGYGDPLERPARQVAADVRCGLYGAGRAQEVFGVVLADDGSPDQVATEAARADIRACRGEHPLPSTSPDGPGAAPAFDVTESAKGSA